MKEQESVIVADDSMYLSFSKDKPQKPLSNDSIDLSFSNDKPKTEDKIDDTILNKDSNDNPKTEDKIDDTILNKDSMESRSVKDSINRDDDTTYQSCSSCSYEDRDDSTYGDDENHREIATVGSVELQDSNCCTNCWMETFQINPKQLVVKIMVRIFFFLSIYTISILVFYLIQPFLLQNKAVSIPSVCSPPLDSCCEEVPLPDSPGFVCIGRVMSKTPTHCNIKRNDRVLCILPADIGNRFETTFANIAFDDAIKVRKDIDPFTLVSLVLTYLPALQILQSVPRSMKNKKILLNGGIGPVNRSLTHLCVLLQAKTIYVPCHKEDRDIIKEIGGTALGPKHTDWGPSLIDEIDVVIDAIGENNYVTSNEVLNQKGILCVIGNTNLALSEDGLFKSMRSIISDYRLSSSDRTITYHFNESLKKDRDALIDDFEYICKLVDKGTIEPIFTKVSLEEYWSLDKEETTILDAPVICDPWSESEW